MICSGLTFLLERFLHVISVTRNSFFLHMVWTTCSINFVLGGRKFFCALLFLEDESFFVLCYLTIFSWWFCTWRSVPHLFCTWRSVPHLFCTWRSVPHLFCTWRSVPHLLVALLGQLHPLRHNLKKIKDFYLSNH